MILCAAIKIIGVRKDTNREDMIIVPGIRHGDCLSTIHLFKSMLFYNRAEGYDYQEIQGFIDTKGCFYNRTEAYHIVMNNGQLSASTRQLKRERGETELYSEDLY